MKIMPELGWVVGHLQFQVSTHGWAAGPGSTQTQEQRQQQKHKLAKHVQNISF